MLLPDGTVEGAVSRRRDLDYETFFEAEYGPTVRLLMSVGVSAEQAQDAAQEAFVRLYARWPRIKHHDSPAAWVRRVAINKARDNFRSESRRQRREERVMGTPRNDIETASSVAGDDEVRRLLLELPSRQREVAALFYVEDRPIGDIADMLGLSAGAVKFHLNRARSNLRRNWTDGDQS